MIKDVEKFCQKYEAYVTESSRMQNRVKRSSFAEWNDPEIYQTIPYQAVKCVEVHMPEDRFRALLEHDEWLYNARMSNYIRGNEAVWIVEQHDRECRIRHENPSVRIAYEKYQTLLKMVDSHYD